MKRNLFFYAVLTGLFSSCDDGNEVTPNAKACFDYSSETEIKAGDEIIFSNCSENATVYAWDFGDGDISTDKESKHAYEQAGEFTVKLIASNETSIDTISKSITVVSTANVENFTFDNQTYSLGKAYINSVSAWETDESGRIHSLVFTESEHAYLVSDESIKGEGVLMTITLVGKTAYDIVGEYSFAASSSNWPDPYDVRTVKNLTVLYGPEIYKDYDDSSESAYDNSTILYEDDWKNFVCNVSKSGNEHTIIFSGTTADGKSLQLEFTGVLEKF